MVSTAFTQGTESHLKALHRDKSQKRPFFLVVLSAAKAAVSLKRMDLAHISIPKTKTRRASDRVHIVFTHPLTALEPLRSFQSNS